MLTNFQAINVLTRFVSLHRAILRRGVQYMRVSVRMQCGGTRRRAGGRGGGGGRVAAHNGRCSSSSGTGETIILLLVRNLTDHLIQVFLFSSDFLICDLYFRI